MWPLIIVEGNVTPDGAFVGQKIFTEISTSLFLQCAVESFEMSVVVRPTDAAVTMEPGLLAEEFFELRSVIALKHLKCEGRGGSCPFQKREASTGVDLWRYFGKRPTRTDVEERIDVKPLSRDRVNVNGIHLD